MADVLTVTHFTVSTTEVALAPAAAGRDTLFIKNTGNRPIFLGPTGVAITDGYELRVGEEFRLTVLESASATKRAWFGISDAATSASVLDDTAS